MVTPNANGNGSPTWTFDVETGALSFTMLYGTGNGWDDFLALLDGGFAIGFHAQTINPNSAYVATGTWKDNSIPEPATLEVLGLGLAGLGLARRRRK